MSLVLELKSNQRRGVGDVEHELLRLTAVIMVVFLVPQTK